MDGERPTTRCPHPALIDRLLAEAADLGDEARLRLEGERGRHRAAGLHARHELGIVATCLGFSVAWLLEQKAVGAGEIDAASASPVGEHAGTELPEPGVVDPGLIELGRRTRAFARRIERLAGA